MTVKLLKWIFILFVSIFLIGIICIIYFSYNSKNFYELREYLNKNSMSIETNNNLDINNVDVYWFSDFKSGQVIKNGKDTHLIYKEYGPNKFVILYKKDTVKEFMYGKSNNWHGHKHLIFLSKDKNGKIEVKIKIIGPDIN